MDHAPPLATSHAVSVPTAASRSWWRRPSVLAALAIAISFVALLTIATSSQSAPGAGDPAPVFEAPLLSGGGSLGTVDLKGKPYVLNFWASWCGPCEEEVPLLQRASRRFESVEIIGVNIKDTVEEASSFAARKGVGYPVVRDEGLEMYDDYGLTGQPETFFVDSSGVILEHVAGPLTEDSLDQLLGILASRDG